MALTFLSKPRGSTTSITLTEKGLSLNATSGDMKFTDVYCGWPGAVHDARVLRNSPLFHDGEGRTDDLFPGQTYIIGDAAYLLKTWLLTGFKDNGHLTAQQIRFTHLLSAKRKKKLLILQIVPSTKFCSCYSVLFKKKLLKSTFF